MTADIPSWRPACDLAVLPQRAAMLRCVREFFDRRGYLEVETPVLSQDVVVDAWIDPLVLHDAAGDRFLQTSPEASMKRLLAAGSGSIYQIARVFRKGERGRLHNVEFTMVEWYGVGSTLEDQMELTEALVRAVFEAVPQSATGNAMAPPRAALSASAFARTHYDAAFERVVGTPVLDCSAHDLSERAARLGVAVPDSENELDKDEILNLLLGTVVEPQLGVGHPEFLHHYPVSQAALAQVDYRDPRTALRFELYLDGVELCNGYQELTDAVELTRRDAVHNQLRQHEERSRLPGAGRMQAAMEYGLPPCSGVALGFDRLALLVLGRKRIGDVLPFPWEIA